MTLRTVTRTPLTCAGAVTRAWVYVYTARLSMDIRDRRRAEIASDVYEQSLADSAEQRHLARTALSIGMRCLLGIPADLAWRLETARDVRRADDPPRRFDMTRAFARYGFNGLTALALAFIIFIGIAIPTTGEDISD